MRQYAIMYKRGAGNPFCRLNAQDHAKLIDKEEVKTAVSIIRANPFIEGICVRVEDEMFNIIASSREALAPDSFPLETP